MGGGNGQKAKMAREIIWRRRRLQKEASLNPTKREKPPVKTLKITISSQHFTQTHHPPPTPISPLGIFQESEKPKGLKKGFLIHQSAPDRPRKPRNAGPRERATVEFVVECAEDGRLKASNVTAPDGGPVQDSTRLEKQRRRLGTTEVVGGYNAEKSEKEKLHW
ncbi:hypothetical protein Salat_2103000 [Sesamum alatum]|uniref:Uncharacterized protein n=1 Tax=Sesamum alatum TaxID=300844 RepID=A0AAE1Y0S0_9LAMI|nr:hypothetical protein Salat_2103000 [Sesamum alatum]